jgi:REP element-mobilizing transposase RayT
MNPIVIAYHLIWTAYGWWLPTDPRGSMSSWVSLDVLKQIGELHFGRKKVQPKSWQIKQYLRATEDLLRFPRLTFTIEQRACIARAFAKVIADFKYTCYACAVMPDHIHLVLRKHRDSYELMVANFQRESHLLLRNERHFSFEYPIWGGHGWSVFLDCPDDIWRTIPYVDDNPMKVGLPRQTYEFVTPYDNWPLHEGHSPDSPYVKRMRRNGT